MEHKYSFPHSSGDTIRVPSDSNDEIIEYINPYYPEIRCLGISQNEKYIFAATPFEIYIWDFKTEELINTFSDFGYLNLNYYQSRAIYSVSFLMNQNKIVAITDDIFTLSPEMIEAIKELYRDQLIRFGNFVVVGPDEIERNIDKDFQSVQFRVR